ERRDYDWQWSFLGHSTYSGSARTVKGCSPVLPFQGLASVRRGKVDLKTVLAGLRKNTNADFHVQGQQFVVLLECGKKLHVTNGLVALLIYHENFACILPLSRVGEEQEQV